MVPEMRLGAANAMSLLELQAFKALPVEYMVEGLCHCLTQRGEHPVVVVIHTNLPAIAYNMGGNERWQPIQLVMKESTP